MTRNVQAYFLPRFLLVLPEGRRRFCRAHQHDAGNDEQNPGMAPSSVTMADRAEREPVMIRNTAVIFPHLAMSARERAFY